METQDYFIAWIIYLLASAGLFILVWRGLKQINWLELRWLLSLWFLCLVFIPMKVLPDQGYLAPALIVFLMDSITEGKQAGLRGLFPLFLGGFLSLSGVLIASIVVRIRRLRRHRRHSL
jgi:hypothetical protein